MSAATSPELFDRRRRACDAGYDAVGESQQYPANNCIEEAVETATRVRIDDAVMQAAWKAYKLRSDEFEDDVKTQMCGTCSMPPSRLRDSR